MEDLSHSTRPNCWVAPAEVLVAAAIVIGHNVYHVVPNEVPLLFVIGWISLKLRKAGWKSVGLMQPANWIKIVLFALVAAIALQLVESFAVDPIVQHFTTQRGDDVKALRPAAHNALGAVGVFVLIWTFAAFGEELVYRGYIMNRMADLFGHRRATWIVSLVLVSILFGIGHWYKGVPGVIDSTVSGLILGGAYLVCRRNLWVAILAHGFSNTIALVCVYFGLAD